MHRLTRLLIGLALCTGLVLTAAKPVVAAQRPVDVCFVLDVTGSMSGEIELAKQKIWFIAGELLSLPGQPDIRLCLLTYRDRSDGQVTQHYDLTHDYDAIYAALTEAVATGGGDFPEAVNQALHEAVTESSWHISSAGLKVVFLIGDAPPHTDYDEPQYAEISAMARQQGILINPVLAGVDQQTAAVWQTISTQAGGQVLKLKRGENRANVSTHYDQDIAVLSHRLQETLLPYGDGEQQKILTEYSADIKKAAESVLADRAAVAAERGKVLLRKGDLVQDLDAGLIDLSSLPEAALPQLLRSMDEAEMLRHLQQVRDDRAELSAVMRRLVSGRKQHLDELLRDQPSFEKDLLILLGHQYSAGG